MSKPSLNDIQSAAVDALKKGDDVRAFDLACVALNNPQAGRLPAVIFGQASQNLQLYKFNPSVRQAILAYLEQERVDHSYAHNMWTAMLTLDPVFQELMAVVQSRKVTVDDWLRIEPALQDSFLTRGLQKLILRNPTYELFFRNIRKLVLMELWPAGLLKTKNLPFLCALAEQCYSNEYVYALSAEEEKALASLPHDNPVSVAILGCYRPLCDAGIDHRLSAVAAFRSLVRVQVLEPRREAELMEGIRREGAIEDSVSQNVRAMYEENPYPRWQSIDLPLKKREGITGRMLIAGCGTGRTATQMGNVFPNAQIVACDISRRSISYAMRMAEKFGNGHVQFLQQDIMTIDQMEGRFDVVECSGVLHHMADPVAGWEKLLTKLEPDGMMLVCLYSEKAREDVKAVRDYIAGRGMEPTAENIRALRAEILDTPGHPLARILRSRDFYTLSEARDLVFHIQETTYSLPMIRKIVDGLGLEFIRFKNPDNRTPRLYAARYPDDPDMNDLDHWHEFEQDHPLTFSGMYKMIFKKKGAKVSEAAQSMIQVAYSG
ncbi:MAG TPA: class I SAM-dependent methyltransferase [Micavibrio sp.]|nr:class I SAM-dependent methyltransferase [Micavibrio sp.]